MSNCYICEYRKPLRVQDSFICKRCVSQCVCGRYCRPEVGRCDSCFKVFMVNDWEYSKLPTPTKSWVNQREIDNICREIKAGLTIANILNI